MSDVAQEVDERVFVFTWPAQGFIVMLLLGVVLGKKAETVRVLE